MTKGGRTVKMTLYIESVHDSYTISPEKLLKNEYYEVRQLTNDATVSMLTQNCVKYSTMFL